MKMSRSRAGSPMLTSAPRPHRLPRHGDPAAADQAPAAARHRARRARHHRRTGPRPAHLHPPAGSRAPAPRRGLRARPYGRPGRRRAALRRHALPRPAPAHDRRRGAGQDRRPVRFGHAAQGARRPGPRRRRGGAKGLQEAESGARLTRRHRRRRRPAIRRAAAVFTGRARFSPRAAWERNRGAPAGAPSDAGGTMAVRIGVPKETAAGETRVALVPAVAEKYKALGAEVLIERRAGQLSLIRDEEYTAATVVETPAEVLAADVVLKVDPPSPAETELLREGSVVVGLLQPYKAFDAIKALRDRKVTSFALELLPRISRAQAMDALTSQASIAGYKAVLMSACMAGRYFPMLTTPAGTLRPAKHADISTAL